MQQQQLTYLGAKTSYVTFGDRVEAFLAVPERGTAPFGAVILGHERYGLVQHTLDLCAKFASYGFVAIAPDMFSRWEGDKAALNAGEIIVPLSDADIRSYMSDSLDYLLASPLVRNDWIAAMGVCQSGDYPLVLNSIRKEIAANVVVYGGAQQSVWEMNDLRRETYESIIERVSAPVLGIWGEDDFVVSVEDVKRLRNLLEAHRKTYDFVLFPHMPHGWFNTTMPGRYRPRETDQAWQLIIEFLDRVRQGAFPKERVLWSFRSDIAPDYDFTKKVRLA
ncbi:MAG: dienelactone hydrolase family protein [Chloroflexota bacterium]